MATKAMIDDFLANKRIALMRSTPAKAVQAGKIDEELAPKGYQVDVVYLDDAEGAQTLAGLPSPVEALIIAVPAKDSARAVRAALDAGVGRIWLQAGGASQEAIQLCEGSGVPTVHGACVLMYAEPVQSVHAFHRWLAGVFGRVAK